MLLRMYKGKTMTQGIESDPRERSLDNVTGWGGWVGGDKLSVLVSLGRIKLAS